MGAGNSNLTSLQGSELARVMKEEYNKCIAAGMSEEQQQAVLVKKYEEALKDVTYKPLKIVTANSRRLNRGVSKDEHGITKHTKGRRRSFEKPRAPSSSTPTKRKSFDKTDKKESKEMVESQSLPTLEATTVIEEPPPNVDTWDSVNGQPSCLICGMVFATPQKLTTHTKFSSLHASNLKKLEKANTEEEEEKTVPVTPTSQEPTSRCKVMYTGTKFFWKTQDNFDIHIYLHKDAKCIEVIAYEGKANTELPRIYLNEELVVSLVGTEAIMERVKELQKDASSKRFKEALPPEHILFEEEKRIAVSSHIVSHLQAGPENSRKSIYNKSLRYVPKSEVADGEGGNSPVYETKPESVIPVFIKRRRHSSEEEIKETLDDLSSMQSDIRQMTQKAERLANLVSSGAKTFSSLGTKRKERLEKYSAAKRRWLWAIDLVLLQNRVAVTKRVLDSYGGKY